MTKTEDNIVKFARSLVQMTDELLEQLQPDDMRKVADVYDEFAEGLNSNDPNEHNDAWLAARKKLREFDAFDIDTEEDRFVFEDDEESEPIDDIKPQLKNSAMKLRTTADQK